MKKMCYTFFCSLLMAAFIGLGVTGCDDDADTSSADNYTYSSYGNHTATKTTALSITPTEAVVSFIGQQFSFRAIGGTAPYTWGAGNSRGTVTSGGSDKSYGVYTASQVGPNTVIVYDSVKKAAVATITDKAASALTVSPSSFAVTYVGQKVSFSAVGGTSPYTWAVGNSRGTVVYSGDGLSGIYTVYQVGPNTVLVSDKTGKSAVANISGAVATLSISPSLVTLEHNSDKVTLQANGGVAPYTWTLGNGDTSLGQISVNTGSATVYQRYHSGDTFVSVRDSVGNVAYVIIKQP